MCDVQGAHLMQRKPTLTLERAKAPITSVGYRVESPRGVRFGQWATSAA